VIVGLPRSAADLNRVRLTRRRQFREWTPESEPKGRCCVFSGPQPSAGLLLALAIYGCDPRRGLIARRGSPAG
jgi:hypothetical protein